MASSSAAPLTALPPGVAPPNATTAGDCLVAAAALQADPSAGPLCATYGCLLTLVGENFGLSAPSDAAVAVAVALAAPAAPLVLSCAVQAWADTSIVCAMPPGAGAALSARVTAAGLTSAALPAAVSYMPPCVATVDVVSGAAPGGSTLEPAGGDVLLLTGMNFAAAPAVPAALRPSVVLRSSGSTTAVVSCVSGSAAVDATVLAPLGPDSGLLVSDGPWFVASGAFVPLEASTPSVTVSCQVTSGSHTSMTCVTAAGGGGQNLAVDVAVAGVAVTAPDAVSFMAPAVDAVQVASPDGLLPLDGGVALTITGRYLMVDGTPDATSVVVGDTACPLDTTYDNNNSTLTCTAPPGIGSAVPVVVLTHGMCSRVAVVAYAGPTVSTVVPSFPLAMGGMDAAAGGVVTLTGRFHGSSLLLPRFLTLTVHVGPVLCEPAGGTHSLQAAVQGGAVVTSTACALTPDVPVGHHVASVCLEHHVRGLVDRQASSNVASGAFKVCSPPSSAALNASCQAGAFAQNDTSEVRPNCAPIGSGGTAPAALCLKCRTCPTGAFCAGGFVPPEARTGFFPVSATRFQQCQPPEACVGGADVCAEAYTGRLCGFCAPNHYRLDQLCVKCPSLAWLYLAGGVVVVLIILYVAYWLNKHRVNLAALSIGVDFLQTVAIFAAFDLKWPVQLGQFFDTVSASNMNVQLVAPECSVQLSTRDQFFVVLSLPVVLLGAHIVTVSAYTVLKRGHCLGRGGGRARMRRQVQGAAKLRSPSVSGEAGVPGSDAQTAVLAAAPAAPAVPAVPAAPVPAASNGSRLNRVKSLGSFGKSIRVKQARVPDVTPVDAMYGVTITGLYVLYIQVSRAALSVLDCTEADGVKFLDVDSSILCDDADDDYRSMYPFGVAAVFVYSIGIPLWFAYVLVRHKDAMKQDQLLRAQGLGDDTSNPNLAVRRRYSRLYVDFRPETVGWRLVLLGKKFMLLATSLLYNSNAMFQASVSVAVLYGAFVVHMFVQPFLKRASVSSKGLKQAASAGAHAVTDKSLQHLRHDRYVFDMNRLEAALLIASTMLLISVSGCLLGVCLGLCVAIIFSVVVFVCGPCVLTVVVCLQGMTFHSSALAEGSTMYIILLVVVFSMLIAAIGTFFVAMVGEAWRRCVGKCRR